MLVLLETAALAASACLVLAGALVVTVVAREMAQRAGRLI